jgi:hypothetical protein
LKIKSNTFVLYKITVIMVSYTHAVLLPISKVWEHFLYKVEHPEHFVPGVSDVQVLEKVDTHVLRQMNLSTPQGDIVTLVERITHKPFEVCYAILEHPKFKGYVLNQAVAINESETAITYAIHWQDRLTEAWYTEEATAKNAVLKSIAYMEQKTI